MNIENRMADEKTIRDAFRGIPTKHVWWALQERSHGVNWRGCGKAYIAECLARGDYDWNMRDLSSVKEKALSYSCSPRKERVSKCRQTQKYTVVGTIGQETVACVISARTPNGAAGRVRNSYNMPSIEIVAIFEGDHENLI